jgi:hypothetical protein
MLEDWSVTYTDEHRQPRVRVLGLLGIVGGIAVLAAFVVTIPPAQNTARIFLFLAGGVGVALAAHEPQARVSGRLALACVIPLVLANGVVAIWELLSLGRDRPFAGDFGLVGFYAGLAMWLAHAWYGIATVRIGVLSRWAAIALVVGSVLAITGMDRLELTSSVNPTIFGPLSLLGIALNGIAWALLGLGVVMPGLHRHHLAAAALRP